MQSNASKVLLLLAAGIIGLVFVKLMYDMSSNMTRMTDYVGSLSRDVSVMQASIEGMSSDMKQMRESIQRMETHVQSMGSAVEQGGKVFQQWDPTKMMR